MEPAADLCIENFYLAYSFSEVRNLKKHSNHGLGLGVYLVLLACFLLVGIGGSHAVTVLSENAPIANRTTVIIDAGHGGVDGGATSCTGVLESKLNLEIALRLDDLMHLLGIRTTMIRTTDVSIHTEGETIAAKKVSDLKERARIVNETDQALLISIHQNYFSDKRYSGAQVFYADTDGSQVLAMAIQDGFAANLSRENHRKAKNAKGIYLMEHIGCSGVLIECGFLSNPQEEALLRQEDYQKKLSCVIATVCSTYLANTPGKTA